MCNLTANFEVKLSGVSCSFSFIFARDVGVSVKLVEWSRLTIPSSGACHGIPWGTFFVLDQTTTQGDSLNFLFPSLNHCSAIIVFVSVYDCVNMH